MNARLIQPEEWLRTEELFALAFEMGMERRPDAKPDEAMHWAAFDTDGEMMSTLTVSDYTVNFDGNACRMGGIGGVATLPQYRRRGGIRACFAGMLPELYRQGYDFSYLYPFSTCFYRQFGYENCVMKQGVKVKLSLLPREDFSGTIRLAEPGKDLREAIRAVDALWKSKYNMAVRHDADSYDWAIKQDPAVKQEFCFVCFRADGSPCAYTVYRKEDQADGRNLQCSKFRFADRQGYRALLGLFRSLASDHSYVKFQLPGDESMRLLMPEWSLGAAAWQAIPSGMVRVVRALDVLRKAEYRGSGSVTLRLTDDWIPENNGTFLVVFSQGKAMCVEKAEAEPDAVLTIPAFSALITGVTDIASAAQWLDGMEIRNPGAPLDRIFYRKQLFIDDYF